MYSYIYNLIVLFAILNYLYITILTDSLQWTKNGAELLCHCGGTIKVLELASGRVTLSLGSNEEEEDDVEDTIHTFVLSADNELIVSSHKSGLLKLWKWRGTLTY